MPEPLTSALKSLGWYKPTNDPEQYPCQGSKFHSPRPLRVTGFRLTNGAIVFLCGTCKDNVDLYVRLQERYKGKLPWEIQRAFGNELRKVSNLILKNSVFEGD